MRLHLHLFCDDDLDAIKSVNLKTFERPFFTTDNSVSSLISTLKMMLKIMSILFRVTNITSTGTDFLRFEKANSCPDEKITVNIKKPKALTDFKM